MKLFKNYTILKLVEYYITGDIRNTNSSRKVKLSLADIHEFVLYGTSL